MTELVLNTYGTCLAKENDNFVVIHKDGRQMIAPDKIRSVCVSRGASITSDAALLAIQNQIDVVFIDNSGKPSGRIWSVKFGSISTIRRHQLDFNQSKHAVEWIKELLIKKLDNQMALLLSLLPGQNEQTIKQIDNAIRRIDIYKEKIKHLEGNYLIEIAENLRGWEGITGKIYFNAVNKVLPVAYQSSGRSQHPAMDIFNCLLNYGYGMLYGKIEGALIRAGIDPYIGIFHRDEYNRPALAYDIIEIYRIWIDYVVINLLQQNVIDDDCYSIKADGSYWLETMGKRILIQSVNDYLSEVISVQGLERSRLTHIELYCQHLAQIFLKFNP
ncbi:MAG: CRISPR-associated endonuclease Cas1 [Sphingobacteriales bacterium]|nr:CRISPR-associated endonuclease Cas1 [Sphingobacteriales bacterium]